MIKPNSKKYSLYKSEDGVISQFKRIRKEKKITQQELASKTSMDKQTISRFENGLNSLSINKLCNLLDHMGYDIVLVPKELRDCFK